MITVNLQKVIQMSFFVRQIFALFLVFGYLMLVSANSFDSTEQKLKKFNLKKIVNILYHFGLFESFKDFKEEVMKTEIKDYLKDIFP